MTRNVQRPVEAPRRGGSFGAMSLVPLAAAALIVAVGIAWLGGRESRPTVGASPSPDASPAAGAESATPPPASPAPEASDECDLQATITAWEGAAGSRIATIQMTDAGPLSCSIPTLASARLVDSTGRVLAEVVNRDTGRTIVLNVGDIVTTMVSIANVCGEPPSPPVAIELDLGGQGVVTARPLTSTDATVPPCNGPGQPSSMEIQPWSMTR